MLFSLYILLQLFVPFSDAYPSEQAIQFEVLLNDQRLNMGETVYVPEVEDSVVIERFKFYVSDVQFWDDEKVVGGYPKKHILVDLDRAESLQLKLPEGLNQGTKITFSLGIDSLTNVSGALGGDLDPTLGMYWTWQSGYINFKLEGRSPICPARKNKFQFHIGGYQHPCNSLQEVELVEGSEGKRVIQVDLNQFFAKLNVGETYQVMSPNKQALEIAQILPSIFSMK